MGNSDAALIEKIRSLKEKKKALILAHYFQSAEIQDIADFTGDSLEIALKAAESQAEKIVVCGVTTTAETVSIFCPDKMVLLPESNATCPLADMITAERLREKKKDFPGAKVVCYFKSPAEVIAESDICCTSANSVKIVRKLGSQAIIFVPDQYLGDFVCTQLDREMVLWPGYCPAHMKIRPEDVLQQKALHPQAIILVHLECTPQVRDMADAVLNTAQMLRFARETPAPEIIIGTETGILHRLRNENPGKLFYAASEKAVCAKMKLITLESVLWSLDRLTHQIKVPESIRLKARKAIDRMLEEER